jgi:hypothetical protein
VVQSNDATEPWADPGLLVDRAAAVVRRVLHRGVGVREKQQDLGFGRMVVLEAEVASYTCECGVKWMSGSATRQCDGALTIVCSSS